VSNISLFFTAAFYACARARGGTHTRLCVCDTCRGVVARRAASCTRATHGSATPPLAAPLRPLPCVRVCALSKWSPVSELARRHTAVCSIKDEEPPALSLLVAPCS
jgi:hypothetical protein